MFKPVSCILYQGEFGCSNYLFPFFGNSFTEIKINVHKIYRFKVRNSIVVFSIFIESCNRHCNEF